MTVSEERTGAERDAGRGSVRKPATLAVLIFVRRWKAPMFWKTGSPPGLSRFRGQHTAGGPLLADTNSAAARARKRLDRRLSLGRRSASWSAGTVDARAEFAVAARADSLRAGS